MAQKILRNRFAQLLMKKAEREGRSKIYHEEVAEKTGLGTSTISRYANNHIRFYEDRILVILSDYLGCSFDELLVKVEVGGADEVEEDSDEYEPLST